MNKINQFNNDFAKQDGVHVFRRDYEVPIFEITSYHALIQFIGYAKYINRKVGNVYLRGQHTLYDTLKPSIFRSVSTNGGFLKRNVYIHNFIKDCAKKIPIFNELDDIVREPLLQHYGIGTRWIDLVDNVWVAIWFGAYAWHTVVFGREYKNVIPRENASDEYFYILLVCSDGINEDKEVAGLYKGENAYTIDLRKAAPSIFLRPHAQHALLMRSKHLESIEDVDMSKYVVGIAKIKLEHGLSWIGISGLTSARSLFPPVNFDNGYGILIEQVPHEKRFVKTYGSIYSVTY
jgi:hypothetical protein